MTRPPSRHPPGRRNARRIAALLILVATVAAWALPAAAPAAFAPAASAQDKPTLVFAAASLRNALDDVNALYLRDTGREVKISYAASSALAKQIEAGAPADIFISADEDWMDYLATRKLIRAGTRRNLLGNELVFVAPADSGLKIAIAPGFPLAQLLAGSKLAMADTSAVPAGKYGKAALEKLGVWAAVEGQIAQAENVRVALSLVARKEVLLGIVYQTDAAAEPQVEIAGTFPADTHPPIIYPIALTASSSSGDGAKFLAYVESAKALPLFEKQGFTVIK
jgi:molybdate transport system substrate-binding protein